MSLTREQARAVDQHAINVLGLPGIVLMENAGLNAAAAVLDLLDLALDLSPSDARVLVVCGGGNNGGDGYVLARHLSIWGASVSCLAVKPVEALTGDAAIAAGAALGIGVPVQPWAAGAMPEADLIVDALLGTGFTGQVREPVLSAIREINASPALRVALDLPSGMDCDTGRVLSEAVRADLTVTFVDHKAGFAAADAGAWLGRVVVADIGVPGPGLT